MTVRVIDNFLPEEYFNILCSELLKEDTTLWCFSPYTLTASAEERPDNMQMVHMIYINNRIYSDAFQIMQPLLDDLGAIVLVRAKVNMTFKEATQEELGWHTDMEGQMLVPSIRSAILYLNDTDGPTKLETGEVIECKANRLVSFPAHIRHTGCTHTQGRYRAVLNLNYIEGANAA